jgi:uncharacterized protein (TIGR02453 family)
VSDVEFRRFEPTLVQFLEELVDHNNRPWFQEHKQRYEREVREPCLAFIRAFQPRLKKISRFFVASDRRVGGSLMRVYRDTRFSGGQSPYKTNVGIQFRHEFARDVHAPGFYVHIAPDECFLAVGMWRPDPVSLRQIREAIVQWPDRWRRTRDGGKFCRCFKLEGSRLRRPPRGFAADHPLVEDLKWTDFVGVQDLGEREVLDSRFADRVATSFAAARPWMRFLCDAIRVPF